MAASLFAALAAEAVTLEAVTLPIEAEAEESQTQTRSQDQTGVVVCINDSPATTVLDPEDDVSVDEGVLQDDVVSEGVLNDDVVSEGVVKDDVVSEGVVKEDVTPNKKRAMGVLEIPTSWSGDKRYKSHGDVPASLEGLFEAVDYGFYCRHGVLVTYGGPYNAKLDKTIACKECVVEQLRSTIRSNPRIARRADENQRVAHSAAVAGSSSSSSSRVL